MPARTNHFQRVIAVICQKCEEEGIVVRESAATEESCGDNREIDVRLTAEFAGLSITIALECRDHGRKQTVEWIDQLIGKFSSTSPPIDRIVAVSRSRFTPAAERKAAEHGILTVSFSELDTVDWPSQFQCIRIAESTLSITPVGFGVSPTTTMDLQVATLFVNSNRVGNLKDFVKSILVPMSRSQIERKLSECPTELFPNMAALKHSVLQTEHQFACNATIIAPDGKSHAISSVLVVLHTRVSVAELDNQFESTSDTSFEPLGGLCVSSASIASQEGHVDVSVIQALGEPTLRVCATGSSKRSSDHSE